jgi:hypothetical protein
VQFDPGDLNGGTIRCTWENFGGAEATATAVAGPVTTVQVQANNITSCGGTTAVQVVLRNASGGPAPAGTSVTASSTAGGQFLPAATLTGNFPFSFATFLYQAPANFNGVATISVRTSNNVVGSTSIQIICGAAAPVPTAAPPTTGPLRPPSAGDGGLLGGGGSDGPGFGPYLPSTVAAVFAGLVLAATLLARRFGSDPAPALASRASATAPSSRRRGGYALLLSLAWVGATVLLKRRRG